MVLFKVKKYSEKKSVDSEENMFIFTIQQPWENVKKGKEPVYHS